MKRSLLMTAALLLIMALSAFATDTRVFTMGQNNNVLLDEANIALYPSRINDYPNLAIGEFARFYEGTDDFTDFGIHWKFDRDNPWVLGTYFSVLPAYYPTDIMGDPLVPFDDTLQDNRRIDLFYGRQLGTHNFGLSLGIIHSSRTRDDVSQEKESLGQYRLGLGLTPTSGVWDLAAHLSLGTWTDEDFDGATETEPDGFFDITLQGRGFWLINPNYTVIPHASLGYHKRGIKFYALNGDLSDLDQTDEHKMTTVDVGMGANYTPASNVLAVADFGFMYNKKKAELNPSGGTATEINNTTWFFPYFKIGLDADIFRWLDVRLGATSFWTSESEEVKGATKANFRYPDNDTYLGFGFHWGRFHVDTYTDPDLFLKGLNFISGGVNDMNFRITALYEMM